MSARCYVTLTRTTYISECVRVIKCIKLNMVKECAMILEFSKDKSQIFSTSSIQ